MARWTTVPQAVRDDTLVVSLAPRRSSSCSRALPEQLREVFEGAADDPARAAAVPARVPRSHRGERGGGVAGAGAPRLLRRAARRARARHRHARAGAERRVTGGEIALDARRGAGVARRAQRHRASCSARGSGVTEDERELDPADPRGGRRTRSTTGSPGCRATSSRRCCSARARRRAGAPRPTVRDGGWRTPIRITSRSPRCSADGPRRSRSVPWCARPTGLRRRRR